MRRISRYRLTALECACSICSTLRGPSAAMMASASTSDRFSEMCFSDAMVSTNSVRLALKLTMSNCLKGVTLHLAIVVSLSM